MKSRRHRDRPSCDHTRGPAGGPCRGVVILAVLVVVSLGALSAAVVVAASGTALVERRVEGDRTRLRLAAWSGLNATMQELAAQREDILLGYSPAVTAERRFGTTPDGREVVFRLIAQDAGGAGDAPGASPGFDAPLSGGSDTGAVLRPEAAGLDVNLATAEMLSALPGIDASMADRLVRERPGAGYPSLPALLGVDGVTPELLWGGGGEDAADGARPPGGPSVRRPETGASSDRDAGTAPGIPGGSSSVPAGGLASLLSIHSAVPDVEAGYTDPATLGQRRLNLNVGWSDRLGRAIEERFGEEASRVVQGLMESGVTFTSDAEVLTQIARFAQDPADWPAFHDALTTSPAPYRLGRVDLNTAPASVLAALPGIDADAAEEIVDRRDRIDDALRLTPLWPAVEGILTNEQMIEAADWLDVRSMQWRVRVEVGYLRPDPSGGAALGVSGSGGGPGGADASAFPAGFGEGAGVPLEHAMRFDAVLDVASTRPRLASCHEVSVLAWWRALPLRRVDEEDGGVSADPFDPAPASGDPDASGLPDPEDAFSMSFGDGSPTEPGSLGPDSGFGMGTGRGVSGFAENDEPGPLDVGTSPAAGSGRGDGRTARSGEQSSDRDNRRGRWTGSSPAGTGRVEPGGLGESGSGADPGPDPGPGRPSRGGASGGPGR